MKASQRSGLFKREAVILIKRTKWIALVRILSIFPSAWQSADDKAQRSSTKPDCVNIFIRLK
jgi:hypothetical protein